YRSKDSVASPNPAAVESCAMSTVVWRNDAVDEEPRFHVDGLMLAASWLRARCKKRHLPRATVDAPRPRPCTCVAPYTCAARRAPLGLQGPPALQSGRSNADNLLAEPSRAP